MVHGRQFEAASAIAVIGKVSELKNYGDIDSSPWDCARSSAVAPAPNPQESNQ